MVIWFASGRGLMSLLPPLLRFAWPVMLVIAALSLIVWPWANTQIQELKSQYEQRSDVDRIAPGQFQESSNGSRVFFIDRDSPDATSASNVFIATNEPTKETVTSAESARLEVRNGDRMALLFNGQRLEMPLEKPGLRVSEFKEYGTRVGDAKAGGVDDVALKSRNTLELVGSAIPAFQGELGWRIGLALAALNFVLLGLAVAIVNPRAGRSSSMAFALFAFVVYYNLMTVGQSWVSAQRIGMLPFMVLLHGGTFALAMLLLAARHNRWSIRSLFSGGGNTARNAAKGAA